ncbi:MAG: YciI family protein [Cytophagaceae bacterium]|nr:YciI family protein [Gemmatimonadaceae bacterium]
MRFMIILKSNEEVEGGAVADEQLLTEMGRYNEELVKAGVMLAGEGLHPSSRGAKVRFKGGEVSVIDGPFAEAKELIAGYWLIQVRNLDEAIAWTKRIPNPTNEDHDVEIRQVFEAEDFGAELTPELRAQEESQRARMLRGS